MLSALGEGSPGLEHLVLDEGEAVNSAALKVQHSVIRGTAQSRSWSNLEVSLEFFIGF